MILSMVLARLAHPFLRSSSETLNTGNPLSTTVAAHIARELKQKANSLKGKFYDATTGALDYCAASGSSEFADYVETATLLCAYDPGMLVSSHEKLAFWINVYNALTVHAIISYGPRESVWEVTGFFDKAAYLIGGMRYSLNDIEHGILRSNRSSPPLLRRRFGDKDPRRAYALQATKFDPRIHFALNCGSKSCPPISFYDAEKIDLQLDLAARAFIRGETEARGAALLTSPIFKWYRGDFGHEVVGFILKYLEEETARQLRGQRVRLSFKKYDWRLNAS